jgi:hypothetical protein
MAGSAEAVTASASSRSEDLREDVEHEPSHRAAYHGE